MRKLILFAVVLALLTAPFALGQATATNLILTATSLNAAVLSSGTTTITLVSSTGVTANSTVLWIEDGTGGNGEAVFVNSVGAGGQVGVTRGYGGSFADKHLSGSPVLIGAPAAFVSRDPSGSCTAAAAYTPTINVTGGANGLKGGNQWICSSITASWVPGYFNTQRPAGVTTLVASVAGATNPTGPLFHVNGTNAITAWGSSTTVGLGAGGGSATQPYGAPFCTIPDAAWTWTATNNIATSGTAVANLLICWVFDGTAKKYVSIQSK
jgi:hypothetical protein